MIRLWRRRAVTQQPPEDRAENPRLAMPSTDVQRADTAARLAALCLLEARRTNREIGATVADVLRLSREVRQVGRPVRP
jgi:hypothetical protein